jgi:hypothetical protein
MPTWVAFVARVRVDRTSGRVIVEKLTLVVDAGTIVHPDGAKAQVEGAALWGLSMALHEGSEFVNGSPRDTDLDTYTPLRMGDVPEIEVELMPSNEAPVGLGEPATTVVAPAIANAIFAAPGARLRDRPSLRAVHPGLHLLGWRLAPLHLWSRESQSRAQHGKPRREPIREGREDYVERNGRSELNLGQQKRREIHGCWSYR